MQELEPRFALAHSPIDAVAPLSDSLATCVAATTTMVDISAATAPAYPLAAMTAALGDDPAEMLARAPGLNGILHKVFGDAGTTASLFDGRVAEVEKRLLSGTATLGVQFRVLDASVMGIHEGGYSASAPGGPTIYLRSDLLQDPPDVIRAVLFEEMGHHIDVMLNGSLDSRGDEGELFSVLVRGATLDDADVTRILADDDHGTLIVDGRNTAVEFATRSNATTSVTYTERTAKVSLQPGLRVGL